MYHRCGKKDRDTKAVQDSHVTLSRWVFSVSECHCHCRGRDRVGVETANTFARINRTKRSLKTAVVEKIGVVQVPAPSQEKSWDGDRSCEHLRND